MIDPIAWWRYRRPHPIDEIMKFVRRGRRGWSHSDAWSLNHYIAGVLAESLEYMAKIAHGCPMEIADRYGGADAGTEVWQQILRDMAAAFRAFTETDEVTDDTRVALDTFSHYFGHLWD
jgi:hypothetical protein